MPISPETLVIAAELRAVLDETVDTQTRQLVAAWARAWDTMAGLWQTAADGAAAGELSAADVVSLDRVTAALNATADQLGKLLAANEITATGAASDLVAATQHFTPPIIASQFPSTAGSTASLATSFSRFDPVAFQVIVARTAEQITSLSAPLSIEATDAMKRALIRGVAQGMSPREVARLMVSGAESGFNGGLARALTISRTEILDAYREASRQAMDANADVLRGWEWQAELDDHTCVACWAMDGTFHELTEAGPDGHQNCRCNRLPVTKSWKDLGFDIEEPGPVRTDAQSMFDAMTDEQQRKVMGAKRFDLYKAGDIKWTDLATERSTPGWRRSFVPTPVSNLVSA